MKTIENSLRQAQAEASDPITVDHPKALRYFMTVEEAVRLTIYAGAIGDSGEVMVRDMGEPGRIADVAARFASQATPPRKVVYIGLQPGEKLHEELVSNAEEALPTEHVLITRVAVAAPDPTDCSSSSAAGPSDDYCSGTERLGGRALVDVSTSQ